MERARVGFGSVTIAAAARLGTGIVGGELIGLIPLAALDEGAEWFRTLENFRPDCVLETRLDRALTTPGTAA